MLIDTHCHIHDVEYNFDIPKILENAKSNEVEKVICVGTSVLDSKNAIDFAKKYSNVFATAGVHPHYADMGCGGLEELLDGDSESLVAVGEIGLDYHYDNSSKSNQIHMLESQIEMAVRHNLPIVFHVREAFDDFWPIFDNFHGIRGVVHCFTDFKVNAEKALTRNLMIGVGGFCTFTKNIEQKEMFANLPLTSVLLETDAPFLTPVPFRGRINEPAYIGDIARHFATLQRRDVCEIADTTTENALNFFKLGK